MNKHIRNIKLYQIGIGTEGKELQDFLKEKFSNLKKYENNYKKSIFYGNSKRDIILEWFNYDKRDEKIDVLCVKEDYLWTVLNSKFNMDDIEIEELILWWVDNELNLKASNAGASPMPYSIYI